MRVLDIGCGWGGSRGSRRSATASRSSGSPSRPSRRGSPPSAARGSRSSPPVQDYRELARRPRGFDRVVFARHAGARRRTKLTTGATSESRATSSRTRAASSCTPSAGTPRSRRFYDPWMNENVFPNVLAPFRRAARRGGRRALDHRRTGTTSAPTTTRTLLAWFREFRGGVAPPPTAMATVLSNVEVLPADVRGQLSRRKHGRSANSSCRTAASPAATTAVR